MLDRIFRKRGSLRLVLTISLAAAIVPSALCLREIVNIRGFLAAAPLDLSDDERKEIYRQTDENISSLQSEVSSAKSLTGAYLTPDREQELTEAVDRFAHSWEEMKEGLAEGMTEGEKADHFLNIFEQAGAARDILTLLENTAATKPLRPPVPALPMSSGCSAASSSCRA